ncbi:hypothetical protein MNBD_BACTEROID03-1777 [hydrothermal vent metagenome]|uniref:GH26 domain-containing protein n=1 Tax=hydrothermal vent metagenome TaxID=652676 RepID=A0A3B0TB35_9ZZZZ
MIRIRDIICFLPIFTFLVAFTIGCGASSNDDAPQPGPISKPDPDVAEGIKLAVPADNKIYHAAYPDFGGTEDIVSQNRIAAYEALAGKNITWAYFSNNWTAEKGGIKFPKNEVETINGQGKVPFIRMMPRSNFDEGGPDPVYTMDAFLSGQFDADLEQWARDAKAFEKPLLVEFGTEVNGEWFPWNAKWNGSDSKNYGDANLYDGMEKFRDAYRRIINICSEQGAKNITWFYHADAFSDPNEEWNNAKGYYPGDDYIDWIGISVYGAQTPDDYSEDDPWSFEEALSDSWNDIKAISPQGKPIAILEWGVIDYPKTKKAQWISDAIKTMSSNGKFYPDIKAISYWHENFDGDTVNLRIDSSPESLAAYKEAVSDSIFITEPSFVKE